MPKAIDISPTEDQIQIALLEWLELIKLSQHFIHIPNEGKRSWNYGKKLKRMGMRKGASDLFIATPRHNYHGAWIELKSKKGKLTEHQSKFLEDMEAQGYYCTVCYGLDSAVDAIKWYFGIK